MPNINNPNAVIHSLLIKDDNSPADGQTTNSVVAQVSDGDTVPLPGQAVTFDVEEGASIQSQVESNAQGLAIATLTSTTAGVYTVTASINESQNTVDSTFFPSDDDGNNPNAVIEDLYVSQNNAQADGASTNEVTAEVTDGNGGLLANQNVTFEADNGALIQSPVLTDELGKARATLTSTDAGIVTVTATINASSGDVEVVFDESHGHDPTAYLAFLQTTDNNAVADGTTKNKVTAEVVGEGGKLLANQSVTFTADNGAEIGSPGMTDASGKATTTLTPGKATVTASINDSSLENEVNFVEDGGNDPTAFISFFMVSEDDAVANGVDANEVTAEIVSGDNRLLAGQSVDFQVTNGAVVDSPVVTNPQGKAVATLTSLKPGLSTVTALINSSKASLNVVFTEPEGNDPTARISSLRTQGDLAAADGQATNSVMVEVVDSNNILLADQSVAFTATNDAVIVSPVLTDEYGKAIASLSSLTAGACQVTASINESTDSVPVNFTEGSGNDPSAEIGTVTVLKDNARADGVESNEVTVTVTDGGGNLLDGQSVRFEADNGAVINSPAVTDMTGKATTTLTSTTAGRSTVTASINDSTESVVVNFMDEHSTDVIDILVSDKESIVNDGTDIATLTATVIDSTTDTVVAGVGVSWSTDKGTVTPATSVTDDRGEAVTQLSDTGDTGTATVTAALNSGEEKSYSVTLQGPATLAVRGGRRRRGAGRDRLS
jgi:hypothetical protein